MLYEVRLVGDGLDTRLRWNHLVVTREHGTESSSPRRSSWPALNEGRSLNPGDTDTDAEAVANLGDAQRRPEPEPRRHFWDAAVDDFTTHRSTKAGA